MFLTRLRPRLPRLFAVAGLLALVAAAVQAGPPEVVILKDGFVLQGSVGKESTTVYDKPSGRTFPVIKDGGFDLLDEGPKVYLYSSQFKQPGQVSKDTVIRPAYRAFKREFLGRKGSEPLPQGPVLKMTEYDAKWYRTIKVSLPPNMFETVEDLITHMDPYFIYTVSPTHLWRTGYRTNEFEPARVRKLLSTHPELEEKDGKPDAGKRIAIARFMLDVGWLKIAKDDVEQIHNLFPGEPAKADKEALEKLEKDIDTATVNLVLKESELALGAARYAYAAELFEAFPVKQADAKQIDEFTKLKAQLQTIQEQHEAARTLLRALLDEVTGLGRAKPAMSVCGGVAGAAWPRKALSAPLPDLVDAGEIVYAELHPDTALRLESFVNLASQALKERQSGRDPTKKPDMLLAVAASGWAMGKNAATPDPVKALKMWSAREAVLGYQRVNDLNRRTAILNKYKRETPVSFDELSQIITLLPPAAPENLFARTGTLQPSGKKLPEGVYKRTALPSGEHPSGMSYYLKLPPEYHHGRPYPVLIVLGGASLDTESVFGSLCREADRNGYILLAPDWTNQFDKAWDYDGNKHWVVTSVLQDAVKNFCVDNDRVFMVGAGEGADLAMDVGMSHPDLFAGVIPVGPIPRWGGMFEHYWQNAQALPFFSVTGELGGTSTKNLRLIYDKWLIRGYPDLISVYKGRGIEWYVSEIPTFFDWMNRKKRTPTTGVLKLGDKTRPPFSTMRTTDNHFYWLGVDEIRKAHLMDGGHKIGVPATIQGDVSGSNAIRITSTGINKLSIYLTADLIDWNKGVTVTLNGAPAKGFLRPKVLEPNLELLLEDYRERGDRRNLLWGKLEFSGIP
jgi:pimeloyl-ACP methyl ester carboxylesterase